MERMGGKSTNLKKGIISNEMDVPEIKEIKVTEKLTRPIWVMNKEVVLNGRFEEAPDK